ncbi:MAG TPA: TRAP transporter large permease [Thermodesulfobacteriota bacterium]|nr:TRAP transporter large permease [Thermodesulfobacteriota bacterium]
MIEIALFAFLFSLLLLTLPIFASLAFSVYLSILAFSDIPSIILAQRMFQGMDNFTLMAIPFFILAADLMRFGGISERLIAFAKVLVGWFSGGLAMAGVMACAFFAAISGSSPATVAAIGSLMIPALIEAGYARYFSVGLLTTAGSLGILIPPSITFILYGAVTGTSIGELFIAGFLPGIFFSILFMIYCYVHAKRHGHEPAPRPSVKEVWIAFRGAAWGLGMPVLILGGIYTGIFTPTEAAAVAVTYGFFVGTIVYRELRWKQIKEIFCSTGLLSASLLLITAGASSFSWLIASQGLPTRIASTILGFSQDPIWVLFLINILLLITGCFLDGASAVIILAPLLLSVVKKLGIDPVHFGVIMVVNMEVGMMTPPVGLNLFVGSGISKMPLMSVARAVIPTLMIMVAGLFFITYMPNLSLILPKLFYAK